MSRREADSGGDVTVSLLEYEFRVNQPPNVNGLVSFLVGGGGGAGRFCWEGAWGGGAQGIEGRCEEKPWSVGAIGDLGGRGGGWSVDGARPSRRIAN